MFGFLAMVLLVVHAVFPAPLLVNCGLTVVPFFYELGHGIVYGHKQQQKTQLSLSKK